MAGQSHKSIIIGWANRDVTPEKPVNLQGQFHMRISQGVKDPLTVTAMALSGEGTSPSEAVVFLGGDMPFMPTEVNQRIREIIKREIPELDGVQIVIHATHTHTAAMMEDGFYPPVPSGVMTGAEYADFFAGRAAAAIAEAWRGRQPAQVAWGLGQAVVGHNRRAVYFDDLSQRPGFVHSPGTCTERFASMYGNTNDPMFSHIEGYENHGVDLLFTWNKRSELTGVIVNLACPSQETEGISLVSADFWHETRLALRKQLGDKVFILPQCAAAGDQSPHLLWYQKAENRMLKLKGIDRRAEIARRIVQSVAEVLPIVKKDIHGSLPFGHLVKTIELPRRMIAEAEADLVRSDIAKLEAKPPSSHANPVRRLAEDSARVVALARCRLTMQRYERQKSFPTVAMELHVIRLGEIAWVTSPFELFLDYGIRIKARSPAVQTFVVQLATSPLRGTGWDGGYLPTARAEWGESYSANIYCNSVGSEGGQVLVEETVKALKKLWPDAEKK